MKQIDTSNFLAAIREYAAEHGIDDIVVLYSVQNFISDRNLVMLTR